MLTEPLPISIFVKLKYQTKQVAAITEKWRVERDEIESLLIKHFLDIGIYSVEPTWEQECFDRMLDWLKRSPDIWSMVKKAADLEAQRRASRRDHG